MRTTWALARGDGVLNAKCVATRAPDSQYDCIFPQYGQLFPLQRRVCTPRAWVYSIFICVCACVCVCVGRGAVCVCVWVCVCVCVCG